MQKNVRLILLAMLLWQSHIILAAAPPMPAVAFVGYFTGIKATEDHQYGPALALWQYQNTVVGIFYHSDGAIADIPRGGIDNVKLHPKSGKLSFESTLGIGIHTCQQHNNVPSQDRFVFDGTLRKQAITGQLQRFDTLHPDQKPLTSKVTLKRDKQMTFDSFDSLEAWQQFIATQIKTATSK